MTNGTTDRVEIDGIAYHVRRSGSLGRPPLLLVHGFTGSGASWEGHLADLEARFDVIAPDLPGHGGTSAPSTPERASVEETADDLAALLDRLGAAPAHVVGYSLGARLALRLAVEHPSFLGRLVLESPSAGIDEPSERERRRTSDAALAERLDREGIEAFVDEWEAQPLFVSQERLPPDRRVALRRERLANDPAGLAMSLRGAGQGAMEPLAGRLGQVHAPTLVVAGALDPVGRRRAEAVASGIPGARLAVVPDAGHRVHLERPAAWGRLVLEFLEELPA